MMYNSTKIIIVNTILQIGRLPQWITFSTDEMNVSLVQFNISKPENALRTVLVDSHICT